MQPKFARIVSLAVLGLALTPLLGCRQAVSEADAKPAQVPGVTNADYFGMVVTPTAKPFVIMSDDGMKYSFTVVTQTKITINGNNAKLDQIKAGDKAAVSATDMEGQIVATQIEVDSTAATAK